MWIEKKAIETLSHLCDGDARVALNGLQMTIQSQSSKLNQSGDSLNPDVSLQSKKKSFTTNSMCKSQRRTEEIGSKMNGSDRKIKGQIGSVIVRTEHVKEGLQKSHILYDRAG